MSREDPDPDDTFDGWEEEDAASVVDLFSEKVHPSAQALWEDLRARFGFDFAAFCAERGVFPGSRALLDIFMGHGSSSYRRPVLL